MKELKPGGLALLVNYPRSPSLNHREFIGRCVRTELLVPPKGEILGLDGRVMSNPCKIGVWYCTGNIKQEMFSGRICEGYALIHPTYLLPIDGDIDEDAGIYNCGRLVVV